jgi:hypothetical protein
MVNSFDIDATDWRFEALHDFRGKVSSTSTRSSDDEEDCCDYLTRSMCMCLQVKKCRLGGGSGGDEYEKWEAKGDVKVRVTTANHMNL